MTSEGSAEGGRVSDSGLGMGVCVALLPVRMTPIAVGTIGYEYSTV
jgi:hypothetical protein